MRLDELAEQTIAAAIANHGLLGRVTEIPESIALRALRAPR